MKKVFTILFLMSLILLGSSTASAASSWTKYEAPDGSYSLHYPKGFEITGSDSVIAAENPKTEEQVLMAMIPFYEQKSSKELAIDFIDLLKDDNPNIRAMNWISLTEYADDMVVFDLTDKISKKEYAGFGVVLKSYGQAFWFSYFAPEPDYYKVTGYNMLQGFIESLAIGNASKAPNIDLKANIADRINNNAKAFLFVLEFTLGAPFTSKQEDVILNEIKNSWRYLFEEELKVYDEYPAIVKNILKMKQKDLEILRSDLEKTLKEWLEETDQSDEVVKIINSSLENRGKVVIKGEPPLTDMSLTAYSEIIAYSRLLQKDSKAKPDQISTKTVNKIKKEVKNAWNSFSTDDKEDIATTPGLWVCLRVQLKYGSKAEQEKIRENLKKLETVTRDISTISSTNENSSNESGTKKPMDMTAHNCLMQIQQQTFNTYMWSRGFNYLPATGKMW